MSRSSANPSARSAGQHGERSLIGEIAVILALKLIALTVLYAAFFSPAHRIDTTPESVGARLVGERGQPRPGVPGND